MATTAEQAAIVAEIASLLQLGLQLLEKRTREADALVLRAAEQARRVTVEAEEQARASTDLAERDRAELEAQIAALRIELAARQRHLAETRAEAAKAHTVLPASVAAAPHQGRAAAVWSGTRRRSGWLTFCAAVLCLTLASCQVLAPAPTPQPRIDSSVVPAPTASSRTADVVYTVTRGTIRDTLTMSGRVVSARSAEVPFRDSGTVSAVHVHSGQEVKQGDVLAELAVDDAALEAARGRATLAELSYESQQNKVDGLKKLSGGDALVSAQAAVTKAQAQVQITELAAQAGQQVADRAAEVGSAGLEAADRQVTLAEVALKQAQDDLDQARADVPRVQARIQDHVQGQALLTADGAAVAAQRSALTVRDMESSLRTAQRHAEEASIKLAQIQIGPTAAGVTRQIASQQLQVAQKEDELKAAKALNEETDRRKDPTGVIAAAAVATVRDANRTLAAEQAALSQLRGDLEKAKSQDQRDIRLAQIGMDQATDEVAIAQLGLQETQRAAQASQGSGTAGQRATEESSLAAAQAKVRSAERVVETDTLKLTDAQAFTNTPDNRGDPTLKLAELSIVMAKADLAFAMTKLGDLRQGTAADDIAREQKQATLLQDHANAARQAIQPVVTLTAPFDATVAAVNVRPGQLIEGRTAAVRLAGVGELSVVANAAESDVMQLALNQTVNVSFPGLADAIGSGTIADISGAAAGAPGAADTGRVTFPVRVELIATPPALKLGMTALLNVVVREASDALFVPSTAIRTVDGRTVVTTILDGRAATSTVRTGATYGSDVEILDGLIEGDAVTLVNAPALARKP